MEDDQRKKLLRSIEICQRVILSRSSGIDLIHPDAEEIKRAREEMGDTSLDAILYWIAFLFEHAEMR